MKSTRGLSLFFVFLATLWFVPSLQGQQTNIFLDPAAEFRVGIELFENEKYSSAQQSFQRVLTLVPDENSLMHIDAAYYYALSSVELFHKDAGLLLRTFTEKYPGSPRVRQVRYHLGNYHYRKKDFKESIEWFNKVELYTLTPDEKSELRFKRGYSQFVLGDYDKAKADFFEIKDVDTRYTHAANYFYSHIAYIEKNYETALTGFLRLVDHESFGPVVPFYIAQIYYLQGKYDEVIRYAPPLLDSARRATEIARIIGESYYRTGKYSEAVPFLEQYRKEGNFNRQDAYQLGFAYYNIAEYRKAAPLFHMASGKSDSLGQNAAYHLADTYMKAGDREGALQSFALASSSSFDPAVTEDALYNYATLSYELDDSPFSEAIKALQRYLDDYPASYRKDEVYSLLANAYLGSKNYSAAFASIQKIKNLPPGLQGVYQKVAFNLGVENLNNGSVDEAIRYFDHSLKYIPSPSVTAQSKFWKADALYQKAERTNDKIVYDQSIDLFKTFLSEPGALKQKNYNTANYNIGYAYFRKKDYQNANIWFRKFVNDGKNSEPVRKLSDAYIRIGDTYYVRGDFPGAAMFYDEALKTKKEPGDEKDYAHFQKAMAMGVQKKNDEKIKTLEMLISEYPNSVYVADATYEAGWANHMQKNYPSAIQYYNKVITSYPEHSMAIKARKGLATIYFNQGELDKALELFREVVAVNPNTEDARLSLVTIRQIYEEKKDPEGYENYLKSIGVAEKESEQDSVYFSVARKYYSEENCVQAVPAFDKYLAKYPKGIFLTDAHYYRATCYFKDKEYDKALAGYNVVIGRGRSDFYESALSAAGRITIFKEDYQSAKSHYAELEKVAESDDLKKEARIALMRSFYKLEDFENAMSYASAVMEYGKDKEEFLEARMILGRGHLHRGNLGEALTELQAAGLSKRNLIAAEAKYFKAMVQHARKEYKVTEKTLADLIDKYNVTEWVEKGFILLGDNYLAQKDTVKARQTYQFFIDKATITELKETARKKLEALDLLRSSGERKQEEITVPLNEGSDKELFNEQKPEAEGGGQ